MTGQNDRQDRSLTGQVRDQAGHCPLTGRYLQPCCSLNKCLLNLCLFHHRKTKHATLQHKDKGWENISNADYRGLGVSGFGQRVQIITTTGLQ